MTKRSVTVQTGSEFPKRQRTTIPISERQNVVTTQTIQKQTPTGQYVKGETFQVVSDPKGPAAGSDTPQVS